jgi:anti-sigma-K factor RskA
VNRAEYIESGIVELYVMKALPAEAMDAVERVAATDPAIAELIAEIEDVLCLLARDEAVEPPDWLGRKIVRALSRDE